MHKLRSVVPSANHLFVFEAAARRLSFTAAARELNVTQPAVSKTIRILERSTGLKLFHRESARLRLTADGQRLYEETQACFDQIYKAISTMRRQGDRDIVRVSFSTSFVYLWLLPRLHEFKALHTDVALNIEESSRDDIDFADDTIDLSARLGDGAWPGIRSWLFTAEDVSAVCSPSYLEEHGPIETAADLPRHRLLHFTERYRRRIGWNEWLRRMGVPAANVIEDVVFSDALAATEAAALGQGVVLGWNHLVDDYVRSGRLVRPLQTGYRSGQSIYLTASAARPLKPAVDLFRRWLLSKAEGPAA
ncbi:LysR substrate-binding domain-containing protein [Labrys monachus]|uniref:LysR family glycine cleavage system transcriptional activator n=1 Tax=Labrys monachus TaxID=217067 RepID=A0ABU0FBN3_9HYPH|nr:LysR substrate-binding domain-containing protein [Labrys monachus]MDQ0392019.1 LysR family glycine cleavage system transcriptional activator [Labrys monachus]